MVTASSPTADEADGHGLSDGMGLGQRPIYLKPVSKTERASDIDSATWTANDMAR